jgi:hypothetical protein
LRLPVRLHGLCPEPAAPADADPAETDGWSTVGRRHGAESTEIPPRALTGQTVEIATIDAGAREFAAQNGSTAWNGTASRAIALNPREDVMFPLTSNERMIGSPRPPLAAAPESTPFPARPLNPELQVWVEEGVRIGLPDAGFWAGCRRGVESLTLSCVPESLRDELADTKTLAVIQGVLAFGDPYAGSVRVASPTAQRTADFSPALADEYDDRVRRLPRHAEFAGMLDYDRRRFFNTLRTARRLMDGGPALAAGLHAILSAMVDVMASPRFDSGEIGLLREALWRVEYHVHREFLSTDWERKIAGNGAASEVHGGSDAGWPSCRRELLLMQPNLKSVDLGRFVAAVESLQRTTAGTVGVHASACIDDANAPECTLKRELQRVRPLQDDATDMKPR